MVTVSEKPFARQSATAESPRDSTEYVVRGTASEVQAKLLVEAYSSMISPSGLPRTAIDARQINFETFEVYVEWSAQRGEPKQREIGDERELAFEIGSESGRITQSLRTNRYPEGEIVGGLPAPNFNGAIGVTDDRVEGVDIEFPTLVWSERYIIPLSQFNSRQYMRDIYEVRTNPLNQDPFRGFEAYEVKFLGAAGSQRGNDDADMTFRFAASPTVSFDLEEDFGIVGGNLAIKLGWDYLWVYYEPIEDDDAQAIVRRPRGVYAEKVYRGSDFSLLGIGVD